MNQCFLSGFVGCDGQQKQIGDKSLTTFTVANTTGSKEKPLTTWFKINLWRKADVFKGDLVLVSGRIKQVDYINKDGDAKKSLEIDSNEINFLKKNEKKDVSNTNVQDNDEIPF